MVSGLAVCWNRTSNNTQLPAPFATLTSTSTASPGGSAAPATLNVMRNPFA